jgi:phosphohistidine phosphatase
MIVGHNPGMHQAALSLIKTGAPRDMDNLATKYPTGALLEITFPVDAWADIGLAGGRLQRFVKPRGL